MSSGGKGGSTSSSVQVPQWLEDTRRISALTWRH
jgi:hypothetical protein